jgi:hypothetical protein
LCVTYAVIEEINKIEIVVRKSRIFILYYNEYYLERQLLHLKFENYWNYLTLLNMLSFLSISGYI